MRPPYFFGHHTEEGGFTVAALVLAYNEPCTGPGNALAAGYPGASEAWGARFKEVAYAERGYVGNVALAGTLELERDIVFEFLPVVPQEPGSE